MIKVIAVVGATGAQGGGLARAILNDKNGEYTLRAVTRKVNSESALKLASQGSEIAYADLDDLSSLRKAFEGAYGVFCLTNFGNIFHPKRNIYKLQIWQKLFLM